MEPTIDKQVATTTTKRTKLENKAVEVKMQTISTFLLNLAPYASLAYKDGLVTNDRTRVLCKSRLILLRINGPSVCYNLYVKDLVS